MASAMGRADLWPARESPEFRLPSGLQRDSFHAMGTTVSLLLPERSSRNSGAMVRALFWEWERALSRFLPQSELSDLNRQAGMAVTVSPLLAEVLGAALDAAWSTDGLYDPTLLPQITQLGYDRSFETLPDLVPTLAYPPAPGGRWREISFDRRSRRVRLPAGAALDFGGIAKGMAVDTALERLKATGVEAALVNAGGDLAVYGLPQGEDAWPVAIAGYRGEDWTVPLHHGAMATSGTARRRWRQGRERRHHLLDPRTGRPADSGLWSVSVVAARCMQAEVAAKVAFVLGPREGAQFLSAREMAGLLIEEGGRYRTVGTWPRHDGRAWR